MCTVQAHENKRTEEKNSYFMIISCSFAAEGVLWWHACDSHIEHCILKCSQEKWRKKEKKCCINNFY